MTNDNAELDNKNIIGSYKLSNAGLKERFLHAIIKGATYDIACKYAGICFETFRRWRNAGKKQYKEGIKREEGDEFLSFYIDLCEAEGCAALDWLNCIDSAMNEGAWQAAAWKLERRFPKSYAREKDDKKKDENTNALINETRELLHKCKM